MYLLDIRCKNNIWNAKFFIIGLQLQENKILEEILILRIMDFKFYKDY